jgi:PA14 domain
MLNSLKQWFKILTLLVALVACGQQEPIPTTSGSTQTKALTSGLTGKYFDNMDFTGTSVTREDTVIDLNFGTSAPVAGIANTSYSVRWTGQIMPAFSETYTFYLTSSDGARLMVNGQVVINDWVDGAIRVRSGTVALVANTKYDIRLEYYRNATNASTVKLEWQSISQVKQIIPTASLFLISVNTQMAIDLLKSDLTFQQKNLSIDSSDFSTVNSKSGIAFWGAENNTRKVLMGIILKGKVDQLFRIYLEGISLIIEDLKWGYKANLGDSNIFSRAMTLTEEENIVRQILPLAAKERSNLFSVKSAANFTSTKISSRVVLQKFYQWIVITNPPASCFQCSEYAKKYQDSVITLASGLSEIPLAAISLWLKTPSLGKSFVDITFGSSLSISLAGGLFEEFVTVQDAWYEYLECIAGRRFNSTTGEGILACPPILDFYPPNEINIIAMRGEAGNFLFRWGNSANPNNGVLEYRFYLDPPPSALGGVDISAGFIRNAGTLSPQQYMNITFQYQCPINKSSVYSGYFFLDTNSLIAAKVVPIKITCLSVSISLNSLNSILDTSGTTNISATLSGDPNNLGIDLKTDCGSLSKTHLTGISTIGDNSIYQTPSQIPVDLAPCTVTARSTFDPRAKTSVSIRTRRIRIVTAQYNASVVNSFGKTKLTAVVYNDSALLKGISWDVNKGSISFFNGDYYWTAPTALSITDFAIITATSRTDSTVKSSFNVRINQIDLNGTENYNPSNSYSGSKVKLTSIIRNDDSFSGVTWSSDIGLVSLLNGEWFWTAPIPNSVAVANLTVKSIADPNVYKVIKINVFVIYIIGVVGNVGNTYDSFTANVANDGTNSGVTWSANLGGIVPISGSKTSTFYQRYIPPCSLNGGEIVVGTITATSVANPNAIFKTNLNYTRPKCPAQ